MITTQHADVTGKITNKITDEITYGITDEITNTSQKFRNVTGHRYSHNQLSYLSIRDSMSVVMRVGSMTVV